MGLQRAQTFDTKLFSLACQAIFAVRPSWLVVGGGGISGTDFIRRIVAADLASGKVTGVVTRFPPEPSGYLHIGHVKAIVLDFGIAEEFGGKCYLRFDDTNPAKEYEKYIAAIKQDVQWLGYRWAAITYASDCFEQLFDDACRLIEMGKAYVCELTPQQIRDYRGTLTTPGQDSPWRDRPAAESLQLFRAMQAGDYDEGQMVLRAKIDMAAPNISMRDPTIYRIKKIPHPRTGTRWNVYPLYDFTHCLCDASEQITHSLCTLEFQDNRALYNWFVQTLRPAPHPQQIEFARLVLNYTITSKRRLNSLVSSGKVKGWDDPRLPTISGLRRRGYTAQALKNFCRRIGVTKKESSIDFAVLEEELRHDLNASAPRTMGVLDPLPVVITNFNDEPLPLTVPNHPQDESFGTRTINFAGSLFIERSDFMEEPPRKFFRLAPGRRVRLRYAFVITCHEVVRDDEGNIAALHCTYDPDTAQGKPPAGEKVKGIVHWIAASDAQRCEVRLYDRLLHAASWGKDDEPPLNPTSLTVLNNACVEPRLFAEQPQAWQLERCGYFYPDTDTSDANPVLNRIVTLRDSWAKLTQKSAATST